MLEKMLKLWNNKINPLGNFDDGLPSQYRSIKGFIYWYFIRNPFHNFCAYWIGFRGKNIDYSQIWNKKQKWNLVLPFFSFKGNHWEMYIGWRPDSKMFGISIRRKDENNR
ncbi:hypothetical protein QI155_05240 [Thermodesulfovibrio sp. 1176]|uniref:hypothetical protein n=1 Tax=unclassified Thermodesulfovibrio TaxID=2645936 RepID=UPI00083B45B2|nr:MULTISPECIES: hypothetical protein [unclassified Thermodesulfovibrio]MDI1471936.1 hypothetical protein [Thermodesulfovibrio sp. 1176]